jgi:hypothetical protein
VHSGELSAQQTDTAPKMEQRQLALVRAMSEAERLELAFSLSGGTREMALAGLQRLHPQEDDATLKLRLAELLYGHAVVERLSRPRK